MKQISDQQSIFIKPKKKNTKAFIEESKYYGHLWTVQIRNSKPIYLKIGPTQYYLINISFRITPNWYFKKELHQIEISKGKAVRDQNWPIQLIAIKNLKGIQQIPRKSFLFYLTFQTNASFYFSFKKKTLNKIK